MLKGISFSLLASLLFGYIYYFSTLLLSLGGEAYFWLSCRLYCAFCGRSVYFSSQKYLLVRHLKRIRQQPWLVLVFLFNAAMMGFQNVVVSRGRRIIQGALSVSLGYLLLPLVMVVMGRIF